MEVDNHLAAALSGMVADARTLVDFGRVAAQVGDKAILYACWDIDMSVEPSVYIRRTAQSREFDPEHLRPCITVW